MPKVVVVWLALSGCSLFTSRVPDRLPANGVLRCEYAAPSIDTVFAAVALSLAAVIIVDEADAPARYGTVYLGLPLLGVGVPYSVSAVYGFEAAAKCRRLRR